jgi:hypothetical protein
MKKFLLILLLFIGFTSFAQKVKINGNLIKEKDTKTEGMTGIWRGFAYHENMMFGQVMNTEKIKYEVQIAETNGKLEGASYSYQQRQFYGKTTIIGKFNGGNKAVNFFEDKLVEWTTEDANTGVCYFTCKLEYSKEGNDEYLIGTYTSKTTTGGDCGGGKIYLTKVTDTEFKKEPSLVKRENELKKKNDPVPNVPVIEEKPKPQLPPVVIVKPTPPKPTPPKQPIVKPNPPIVKKEEKPKPKPNLNTTITTPPVIKKDSTPQVVKVTPMAPKPPALKQRDNEVVKTIATSAPEIRIELYDNGEVDGDTITVYHNNQVIANRQRLTTKPIVITLKNSAAEPRHELTMVANNLGEIPPNTALMIVKAGGQRYEIRIVSSEQKNAVVIFEYKPD